MWWNKSSGYGANGNITNGVLMSAVLWTLIAFPIGFAYVLGLEVRRALSRKPEVRSFTERAKRQR